MISFAIKRLRVSVHMLRHAGAIVIRGHGIKYTNQPPYFSERNGYVTPFAEVFGYRFFYIRRAWI
jgi:hypothetical protein